MDHAIVDRHVRVNRHLGVRRLILQRLFNQHGRLNALEHGAQALYTGPRLPLPCVQEGQTDLAGLVQIGIETCAPVIREIRERRGLKGIVVRESDLKAEGPAIVWSTLCAADSGPAVGNVGFVLIPE